MTFRVVVFVVLLTVVAASANSHSLDLDMVRRTMAKAMRCYNIEKLQLGVAMQDKTQHKIRLQLQPDNSVTELGEDVKFYIASITKGMFSVALARIEKDLQNNNSTFSLFTTPVKEWFGEDFWFLDHERTKMLTIDDMVSHSTGLARHDLMWYFKYWKTKDEIFRYTRRLKPSTTYRASFLYNNLVWTIADLAVEHLTKKNFTAYMRQFLWNPLNMQDTYGVTELTDSLMKTVAMPKSYRSTGMPLEASMLNSGTRSVEAAGGVVLTLNDMLKYMQHLVRNNYTSLNELPQEFKPINSYVAHGGFNAFRALFFNEAVTDLPQSETESYTRGWIRSWYRDNLLYTHSGSLHGIRSDVDVYLKRGISVFNHMTLGASKNPQLQSMFAGIFNKFVGDLLLQNSSFVTEENVCNLFKEPESSAVAPVPRRHLTESEINTVVGHYSSYGLGTVRLSFNETAQMLVLVYGLGKLELIPVHFTEEKRFEFFIELLEPVEFRTENVLNRTDQHIYVPQSTLQQSALLIAQQENKIFMQSAMLEVVNVLEKDLDVNGWTRPELCPESKVAVKIDSVILLTLCMTSVSIIVRW